MNWLVQRALGRLTDLEPRPQTLVELDLEDAEDARRSTLARALLWRPLRPRTGRRALVDH